MKKYNPAEIIAARKEMNPSMTVEKDGGLPSNFEIKYYEGGSDMEFESLDWRGDEVLVVLEENEIIAILKEDGKGHWE